MSWRWVPDRETEPQPRQRRPARRSVAPSKPRVRRRRGWASSIRALSAGVRAVSLYEADRLVYGPMSLEPDVFELSQSERSQAAAR